MDKILNGLLEKRKLVLIVFSALTALSLFAMTGVKVNFNLADYLPDDAPSTIALRTMYEEFGATVPNLKVYIPDITVNDALRYKKILEEPRYVESVLWLDDTENLLEPLEMADSAAVQSWYKNGAALFLLTLNDTADESTAIADLRKLTDGRAAFAGEAADHAAAQETTLNEVTRIIFYFAPLILIILVLATNSWFSPVLFVIPIASSILLNLGTNIFFGQISFLTQSVAPILQLAVSMDYAIFLLSAFDRNKEQGLDAKQAMALAVKKTASTVIASAATTFIGFLVLGLMRFKIGPDLGFVLAKGIVFSMLSSLILLPAVTLSCNKLLSKTAHRRLLPSFKRFGKIALRVRIPVLIIVLILLVPCFLAQRQNNFTYGSGGAADGSRFGEESVLIENAFGADTQLVLLVPYGSAGSESELSRELSALENVTSVISFTTATGGAVPEQFVPENSLSQLYSENWSRFILTASVPAEGERSFKLLSEIYSTVNAYYGDNYLICGETASSLDIKETAEKDNTIVTTVAIIAIAAVLILTFRSLSIPIALLLTIQAAIWINLAYPYFFSDNPLHYIAYLIVNTVQLGATIDYAILFTEHYREGRLGNDKKASVIYAVEHSAPSVFVSAMILLLAGLVLSVISSNFIVSEFGLTLARGTALSALLVLVFLPALLYLLDKIITKTTWRHS